MTSMLILNHHQLVREGWSTFLGAQAAIRVAGETGDYAEACRLAGIFRPDVILVYIDLVLGPAKLQGLHQVSPHSKIIMVTPACPADILEQLGHLRVQACLSKNSSIREILTALTRVKAGFTYLSESVLNALPHSEGSYDPGPQVLTSLTDRELEIAGLLGLGKTSREVAGQLHISTKTIEDHRRKILKKLACKNTVQLVLKLTHPNFDYQHPFVSR